MPKLNKAEICMTTYRPPEITDPALVESGRPVMDVGPYARVIFGWGAVRELGRLVKDIGAARPAVICTPDRAVDAERVMAQLTEAPLLLAEAVMHSPVAVSEMAAGKATRHGVDLLISIGGGSSIGLGKALTKRLGLPHITLPTTYAGSEVTPILGQTNGGEKLTERDDRLRPSVIIYDPDLGLSLPARLAAASGMNALAHAVEALTTSRDENIQWAARRSITAFADALPKIVSDPADPAPRANALYAAWLAGYCLAEAPMALHHKLCHALGGAYDMPHAETHAALLPHSFAYNAPACPDAVRDLTEIFAGDPVNALFSLVKDLGLSMRLSELGLPQDGIDRVARLACANPYANPRAFDVPAIAGLLRRGWGGERPLLET